MLVGRLGVYEESTRLAETRLAQNACKLPNSCVNYIEIA